MWRLGLFVQTIITFFFPFQSTPFSEEWTHHLVLDKRGLYHVRWTVEEDTITFLVEVETKGYVGFGLSKNGGMQGSDIVTGWVEDDGQVFFQDRHGLGNFQPVIDETQNWELLRGKENETHTALEFRRKLNTCDDQDLKIDENMIWLIYAYTSADPKSAEVLPYHGTNRGSRGVDLFKPKLKPENSAHNVLHWDVLSPNFTVTPDQKSVYWCKVFKGPEVSSKHHILKMEPLIRPGYEDYIHHILFWECMQGYEEELELLLTGRGHYCYQPNQPEATKNCEEVFLGWNKGLEEVVLPENAGFPLQSPPKYYYLEIHYNNTLGHEFIDQSGLRITYTPDLRETDAGVLVIGSPAKNIIFLPPGQKEYTVVGHTNLDCLGPELPPEGIRIIGRLLHTHRRGRRLTIRHFRNNVELKPIAEDKNFDFSHQNLVLLPEERSYLMGDQLSLECTYNTEEESEVTYFGYSSSEEMCLSYLVYYPLIKCYGSLSLPSLQSTIDLTGLNVSLDSFSFPEFRRLIQQIDWNSMNVSAFGNALRYTPQETFCYMGHKSNSLVKSLSSYPKDYVAYHESYCELDSSSYSSLGNRASVAVVTIAFVATEAIYSWRQLL